MNFSTPLTITDKTLKSWTFDTLEEFEIFIKNQADFWKQRLDIASKNPTADQYIQRYISFQAVISQITAWRPQFESWDSNTLFSNCVSLVANHLANTWLWSGHPFVAKWLELNQTSPNIADAFFEAIVQKTTSRASGSSTAQFEFYQGYIIAYEYVNQDKTDINKRRSSEVKSLNQLRDQLMGKHNELIGKVDKFENDFSTWHDTQKKLMDDTVLAQSKNFHDQLASWINKHTELENQFREKLRFDSAATYWGNKVIIFRKQGYKWAGGLLVFLALGIVLFSKFFLGWLRGQPTGLGLQSIEGILIFATILSSYAFLIKSLSKMTFSSFHLMRDAEEREQLTHLYLSLREGKDDDPESRKIVLQALFSRSDTGLLTGEHSPTMPTVQDAIKIIKP